MAEINDRGLAGYTQEANIGRKEAGSGQYVHN